MVPSTVVSCAGRRRRRRSVVVEDVAAQVLLRHRSAGCGSRNCRPSLLPVAISFTDQVAFIVVTIDVLAVPRSCSALRFVTGAVAVRSGGLRSAGLHGSLSEAAVAVIRVAADGTVIRLAGGSLARRSASGRPTMCTSVRVVGSVRCPGVIRGRGAQRVASRRGRQRFCVCCPTRVVTEPPSPA